MAFGNINIGSSSTLQVTVTNSGHTDIAISNVSVAGPGFGASGISTGQVLAPGQSILINVIFAPSASASVAGAITITSDATDSPTTISLSGGGLQPTHEVTLSWSPSASGTSEYSVYRSSVPGGPYTKLTPVPIGTTSYVDTTVQSGNTYYYVVTAVDSNNVESGFSGEVSATIPSQA